MKNIIPKRTYTHQYKETARHDPYRSQCKPQGIPLCPVCKAVNYQGRWVASASAKALRPSVLITGELECPACKQQQDRFALGVVELHGENWKAKKDLVLNTIRRTEEIARNRNDQERVLWTKNLKNTLKVYVSLPDLARQIGRELEKSFQGISEYEHSTEEPYLRVRWWSDLPHMKHRPDSLIPRKKK